MFERVCEELIAARIERGDLVVALGGGVIGDLAGFAASAVRRGIDFVQVPTTLLAQVDSSVGGKTGINSRHGKNLVGAFHQPILVVADTALLDTLPPRIMRAGYAEVAKYGLIGDADFFAWLEANWRDVFAGAAAREHARRGELPHEGADRRARRARDRRSCAAQSRPHLRPCAGSGRRLLRPALSWRGDFHRDGAGLRVLGAARACARRPTPSGSCGTLRTSDCRPASPTFPGDKPDADRLIELIGQDKKVRRGRLTFILARGIGESFIAPDIDVADVRRFPRSGQLDADRWTSQTGWHCWRF